MNGQDALLTMANMPPGVPVGTVGIDNGRNAAIVAGEILAISDKNIEENLKWIKYENADLWLKKLIKKKSIWLKKLNWMKTH